MKNLVYNVKRTHKKIQIDGVWDKSIWRQSKSIEIINDNGWETNFMPKTQVKLLYDEHNLYVIFRVEDKYVFCETKKHNQTVWTDSCVEFFFFPNGKTTQEYFNLEINCGGKVLMAYQRTPKKDFSLLEIEDINQIEVAHSLPELVEEEIRESVTWTIEYRIPLNILQKYTGIASIKRGDKWRANFYKCAENNTRPHWLSWSKINYPKPEFHLPQFFGRLNFL